MIVTYLRSSSIGCHAMCPMKYYLIYELGFQESPNMKAEKGTIVHKVMEILALIKKGSQDGLTEIEDDAIGKFPVEGYSFDNIIERAYDYYVSYSPHTWKQSDFRECSRWCYKTIESYNGEYDPRNCDIVAPEQAFDIEINKPWAAYEYQMPNGELLTGNLAIKGTIDQVSKLDDDTYQILDFKTGKRINWATMEEKTMAKLQKDPQLLLYYYAIRNLYPEILNIELVIYFINDGGPFTMCFTDYDYIDAENMIRKEFETIKNTELPSLSKTWKCKKFCFFGKNTFKGTHVTPIIERREGKGYNKSEAGEPMTMCSQVEYLLGKRPMGTVTKHLQVPGFSVSKYKAPGEVSE